MKQAPALATDWLANRRAGCPLGGPPLPIDYQLTGPKAPAGLRGFAEFKNGRLRTLSFSRGASTAVGVTVGKTTTKRMAARYRATGYKVTVRYVSTFQGTFVTVTKDGKAVIGGFGSRGTIVTLGIPSIPICE